MDQSCCLARILVYFSWAIAKYQNNAITAKIKKKRGENVWYEKADTLLKIIAKLCVGNVTFNNDYHSDGKLGISIVDAMLAPLRIFQQIYFSFFSNQWFNKFLYFALLELSLCPPAMKSFHDDYFSVGKGRCFYSKTR